MNTSHSNFDQNQKVFGACFINRMTLKKTVHLSPQSLVYSRFMLNMASSLTEVHTKPRIQTARRQKWLSKMNEWRDGDIMRN